MFHDRLGLIGFRAEGCKNGGGGWERRHDRLDVGGDPSGEVECSWWVEEAVLRLFTWYVVRGSESDKCTQRPRARCLPKNVVTHRVKICNGCVVGDLQRLRRPPPPRSAMTVWPTKIQ